MTDKERVEKFKSGKIAINCSTEEEAIEFVKWCHDNNIEWLNSTKNGAEYDIYLTDTCYMYHPFYRSLWVTTKRNFEKCKNKIITYKEFMNKPITNLEYILNNFNKEIINETDCICETLRNCLGMPDCCGIHCRDCKFDSQYEVLKALNDIHKENNISLTKVQYEILKRLPQCSSIQILNNEIIIHKDNLEFFLSKLGVKIIECDCGEKSIKIKDILENCEVVENVD